MDEPIEHFRILPESIYPQLINRAHVIVNAFLHRLFVIDISSIPIDHRVSGFKNQRAPAVIYLHLNFFDEAERKNWSIEVIAAIAIRGKHIRQFVTWTIVYTYAIA